jgi:hydroxyacylglutathione hydrolase
MSDMRLTPIPAFDDNYIWLLSDFLGSAVVVDPGNAAPVLEVLRRERLDLAAILITHHHNDHIGGVRKLFDEYPQSLIYAPDDARIPLATRRVQDGDTIEISEPACQFEVLAVPGHTLSHIAYFGGGRLFCGDTLFSLGCGRLFEGSPAQMLASLDRLSAFPGDTLICCAHEYTLSNGAFALSVDPQNPDLHLRLADAKARRLSHRPTLPSTLSSEMACNPFLRIDTPSIVTSLSATVAADASRAERFAALRHLKDQFRN